MATGRFSNIIIVSVIVLGILLITIIPNTITGAATFNDEIVKYNQESIVSLNVTLKSSEFFEMGRDNLFNVSIRPKGNTLITNVSFTLNSTLGYFVVSTNGTSLGNSLWQFNNLTSEITQWSNTTSTGLFSNATNETFYVNISSSNFFLEKTSVIMYVNVTFNNTETNLVTTNTSQILLQVGTNISIVSPQNYTWHRSNFLTNISVNDTADTVTNLSYRYENSTLNGSWIMLGNLTGILWNDTFNISTTADGNYTLRFNITARLNTNATITETIFVDKTIPKITSFYAKKPEVLVGETLAAQDFVCVAIDNSTLISNNFSLNYVITGFSTSDAGSRTATCTVTDPAQNIALAFVNYTVKLLDQQTGGPTFGSATRVFGEVQKDGYYLFNDLNDDIGIYSIEFISKVYASNVNVKAEHLAILDLLNKQISNPIADVYLFVELSLQGLTDKDITDMIIKFSVTKEWLIQQGLSEYDVILLRYDEDNSQWWPINVEVTSEEDFHFNYKTTIPKFAVFAIASNFQGTEQSQQISGAETQSISETANQVGQNFLSFLTGRVAGFQLNTSSPSRLVNILVVLGALMALILVYMRAFEGKLRGPIMPKKFKI